MSDLIEALNKRIALMKEMPDLVRELEVAVMRIEQLERENQALATHKGSLEAALSDILNPIPRMQRLANESGSDLNGAYAISLSENHQYLREIAADALAKSPQTSLADMQANQARKSFRDGALWATGNPETISFEIMKKSEQHAQQIRNGGD